MLLRDQRNNVLARAAFTLLEILVVVAIIVALAGVGGYYVMGAYKDSQVKLARSHVKTTLTQAVNAYILNHQTAPQSLDVLLQPDPANSNMPYLKDRDALIDPWGQPYVLDANGTNHGGSEPDIYTTYNGVQIGNWSTK